MSSERGKRSLKTLGGKLSSRTLTLHRLHREGGALTPEMIVPESENLTGGNRREVELALN